MTYNSGRVRQHRRGYRLHKPHRGTPVRIGSRTVYLGGTQYFVPGDLQGGDFQGYDIVVVLKEQVPEYVKVAYTAIAHYPIPDFSGVPENWAEFIAGIARKVEQGLMVLAFCAGGHGRTGTLLASLIATSEPRIKDPIAAARRRYCEHAVETKRQAEAVFALKGMPLPDKYRNLR